MGLRFDPIGGGKFKNFVQQLIQIEREPIRQMEARKIEQEQKLKTFQGFKSKFSQLSANLSNIDSLRKFRELRVDLGDGEQLVDVTVDKLVAQPGSYQIQVDELASRSAMISNFFEDPNEPLLGMGYVVVDLPDGGSHEVFIDDSESSLYGVARKINSDPESPITAEVVKDAYDSEQPYRLIVKAKKEGYHNNIGFPEFYFLDGGRDFYVEEDQDSQNAYLKVDGFEIDAEGNEIKDFFQGVNLNLKQARPDKPFTMNITVDYEKVTQKVGDVVNNINEILTFVKEQNSVNESSNTRVMFTGDTGLQTVEYRIRNLLHEAFPVWEADEQDYRLVHLNETGIEFSREGLLSFNQNKFQKALESDFKGISEAITGERGFIFQLKSVIEPYTRPVDGFLNMREQGLRDRISRIDQNIANKERVLERKAKALTDRFSRLQGTLGSLQSQQAALGSLGAGPGNNMLQNIINSTGG